MSENGRLTERGMRLMKKYGFGSEFAYRTFMSMKGERMEGDGNKGQDAQHKTHEAWPYAV